MVVNKIIIGIWDNRAVYNIPTTLADTMMEVTRKFANTTITACPADTRVVEIFTFSDLNSIIDTLQGKNYTHFVLLASGCVIHNPGLFMRGVSEQIQKNPGMCLSGQILHTGLWANVNNPEFFTLHEQMLLFSEHAIGDMRRDSFVFKDTPEFSTDSWRKIQRDSRNVHDNYTPLDVWTSDDKTEISLTKPNKFGFFEDVLQFCIKTNWHVQNFNWEIRSSKQYTYHNERPEQFADNMNKTIEEIESIKDSLVRGHYEFFAKMKLNDNVFWAYNTEDVNNNGIDTEYDCFVTLAAGSIPWIYLSKYNFADNTTVHFIDISRGGISFTKWFLQNYAPNKFSSWKEIVDTFVSDFEFEFKAVGNPDMAERMWSENHKLVDEKWDKIKQFNFKHTVENLITSNNVSLTLENSHTPLVWFSNIFRYFPDFEKNYNNDIHLQNFLNKLIKANRRVSWIGISPDNNKKTNGKNSVPTAGDIGWKPWDIPEFNSDLFVSEIQRLEELNLFTDHRGGEHPGWSSFVLHGLGYNKTLGYENYGYANDKEAPYDWTPEAIEHCPNMVEYFKNAGIKSRYHRLRIMKLAPGGYISIHDDDPGNSKRNWALNMAVNNPENCEMHFWDDDFQYAGMVPWAPGKAFLIRIHWKHMVMNLSDTTRYHIIIHGEQ